MCNVRGRLRVVSSYPKSHRHPWTDCGARRRVNHFFLDHDALDLIEADLIAPAIVELGRARRGVVGHRCGLLKRAAVLEIGRDPGRPEAVIAEPGCDARRGRAPGGYGAARSGWGGGALGTPDPRIRHWRPILRPALAAGPQPVERSFLRRLAAGRRVSWRGPQSGHRPRPP